MYMLDVKENTVDVKLLNTRNTHDIFWSNYIKEGSSCNQVNSYVKVRWADINYGGRPLGREFRFMDVMQSEEFAIASVNGIGEVRWWVNGKTAAEADLQAVLYFISPDGRVPNYKPYEG